MKVRARSHPGFLLAWEPHPSTSRSSALERVQRWPLEWSHEYESGCPPDATWLLCKGTPPHPLLAQVTLDGPEGLVVFHGILYSPRSGASLAEELLAAVSRDALERLLPTLSGTFCGVVLDRKRSTLYLFTDSYGIERLYYVLCPGGWRVSTDPFVLAQWCGLTKWSSLARGSLLYAGYLISGSLIEGIARVHPGCVVRCGPSSAVESEWVIEPPCHVAGRGARELLDAAHRRFWEGPIRSFAQKAVLMLSRGKDSRVLLKYMLDSGYDPRIVTYEVTASALYPFVTFQRGEHADSKTAASIARAFQLPFDILRLRVGYLLDHLPEVIGLNHGAPLHWEALAAAEAAAFEDALMICGFEGDVMANLHASPSTKPTGLADDLFHRLGAASAYQRLLEQQDEDSVCIGLPPLENLREAVRAVFNISRSPHGMTRGRWGYIRVVGAGKNAPTFHQMRRYRIPVYPYLDSELQAAYAALAPAELVRKFAHFALIATDHRFCRWPVSRTQLPAWLEWQLLRVYRWGMGCFGLWPTPPAPARVSPSESAEIDSALERTWADLGGSLKFWRQWSRRPRPEGFYAISRHLIHFRRIMTTVAGWVPGLSVT